MPSEPLPILARVRLWDATLARLRAVMRMGGMHEVVTPVRVRAPAIEPYIDPIAAPPQWLVTSPELAMKVLLAQGSGPIFQLGPVFRREEEGALHREEFHLLEWYRMGDAWSLVHRDVEAVVAAACQAVEEVLGAGVGRLAPVRWQQVGLLDAIEETTGIKLRGDETPAALQQAVRPVGWTLDPGAGRRLADLADDPEVADLAAWTALFSLWSDEAWPRWWARSRSREGVHVVDFPPALAALARCEDGAEGIRCARRFESHFHGFELANGYAELADAKEQRRRFERVNRLRVKLGNRALPMDEGFLAALEDPGLPDCCGAALGVERLLAVACKGADLATIALV